KRRPSTELPPALVEKILANDLASPVTLTQGRQPSINISPPLSLDPASPMSSPQMSAPASPLSDPGSANMLSSPSPLNRGFSGHFPFSPKLNRAPSAAEKKEGTEIWL